MKSETVSLNICTMESQFGVVSKALAVCADHGSFAAILTKHSSRPSGCPVCAQIRRTATEVEEAKDRMRALGDKMMVEKLGSAMIPARFAGKTFESYKATTDKQIKALTVCKGYAENFRDHYAAGRCLMLLGTPGTGKTHLAASIADYVMRTTQSRALYRTVGGILQYIKGSYGSSDYTESQAFAALTKPQLLIIDEVGATKPTEFELATLFQIINTRYEEQMPTILVSNLMPKELGPVLGDRCVDRLREGGGIALVFDWGSARKGITE
jgi:DNA replication protein DnaC